MRSSALMLALRRSAVERAEVDGLKVPAGVERCRQKHGEQDGRKQQSADFKAKVEIAVIAALKRSMRVLLVMIATAGSGLPQNASSPLKMREVEMYRQMPTAFLTRSWP